MTIGPIVYGYKLISGITSADDEKATLNNWIKEKENNPVFRYGRQRGLPLDPTSQTEDLGDDSMIASEYGIKNLKRIIPELAEWTAEDGKFYTNQNELYDQAIGQFRRYLGHVTANIGGVVEDFKTFDQGAPVYVNTSREKQKRAMRFLDEQLFQTPTWIVNNAIIERKEAGGNLNRIQSLQDRTLRILLNADRLSRISDNMTLHGENAYRLDELFGDLDENIFKELSSGTTVDAYRRNLQRSLIKQYTSLLESKDVRIAQSDVRALARSSLQTIRKFAQSSMFSSDKMTAIHAKDIDARIVEILDLK